MLVFFIVSSRKYSDWRPIFGHFLVDVDEISVITREFELTVRLARPLHYVTANLSCTAQACVISIVQMGTYFLIFGSSRDAPTNLGVITVLWVNVTFSSVAGTRRQITSPCECMERSCAGQNGGKCMLWHRVNGEACKA